MNINKSCSLVCLILLLFSKGVSQQTNDFSFGMSAGYRLNSGSLVGGFDIKGHTTITAELSVDKYQGLGLGFGAFSKFLKFGQFSPLVGLSFTRVNGGQVSYGPDNSITIFKVTRAYYLTPWLGANFDIINSNGNDYMSIFVIIGYKISTSSQPKVSYMSGPPMPDRFSKIESYIIPGMVGSIGFIAHLHPYTKRFKGF